MTVSRRMVVAGGSVAAIGGMAWRASAADTSTAADTSADIVFYGGPIVTMTDAQPTPEAVAVKNGKIVAVGAASDIRAKWVGSRTRIIDLGGKTLMPGFIDAHGHFVNAPRIVNWANVSLRPVGTVEKIPDIIGLLQENKAAQNIPDDGWVIGYGYDGSGLSDKREMTRHDLDAAFPNNLVMAIHVSNHGGVLNTAALRHFKITAETPDPDNGVITREPNSREPAGLLMEGPFIAVFEQMPQPDEATMLELLKPAQQMYASKGVTTAQEGATLADELAFLRTAGEQSRLYLDVVSLPLATDVPAIFKSYLDTDYNGKPVVIGDPSSEFGHYKNRVKLGGIKLIFDGSPQGKTAYWTKPLLTGGPSNEPEWVGMPAVPAAIIDPVYAGLTKQKIQVWSHANGDAAIDMVIAAADGAGVKAADDRRHVVIHSQCMRPDQLDSYARLGLSPSFFTAHVFFWGDVHLANLGLERASFISPMNSASAKDIRFSNHNDFMVTPVDPMLMVWTAVARQTKDGVVLGPDERADRMTALKAVTIVPAWQYREEATKGSIEVGKLADLVILDRNPLEVPVDDIRHIKVVQTFKEGSTIYPLPPTAPQKKSGANDTFPGFRRRDAQARTLFADDGSGSVIGCACCDGSLTGLTQAAVLKALTELASSPLLS